MINSSGFTFNYIPLQTVINANTNACIKIDRISVGIDYTESDNPTELDFVGQKR